MKTAVFSFLVFFFASTVQAKECVVLLHGLARTEVSMRFLESTLQVEGYKVVNIGYPSRRGTVEYLSETYVPKSINICGGAERMHIVTHSMGGILIRYYFENFKVPKNLGHVVMMGPPNQGSEVVDGLKDRLGFDFLNGPAGRQLGTDEGSVPIQLGPVDYSVGVIAGTRSSLFLSKYIEGPNDGKVSVESTKVEGMADHISFHASHTFMMNKGDVVEQVLYFLKNGKFNW